MSHHHDLADVAFRVLACIGWTFLGVLILYFGAALFDKLDPIDYKAEIEKGNLAAALKFSAVILAIAAIVAVAIAT